VEVSNQRRSFTLARRVWRYQRGNQNPYIEKEQTTQWPKEKVQKDKQRSTKHTYKTKDRVTRIPLKTGGELRCSGRVGSSCSTMNFHHDNVESVGFKPLIWGCKTIILIDLIIIKYNLFSESPIWQYIYSDLNWKWCLCCYFSK
jgi:hypothetical protein